MVYTGMQCLLQGCIELAPDPHAHVTLVLWTRGNFGHLDTSQIFFPLPPEKIKKVRIKEPCSP